MNLIINDMVLFSQALLTCAEDVSPAFGGWMTEYNKIIRAMPQLVCAVVPQVFSLCAVLPQRSASTAAFLSSALKK